MKVFSAIQFQPRLAKCRADVSDNIRKCEPLIKLAGRLGSHLIVFPEMAFTGYSFLGPEEIDTIAEPTNGPTFQVMRSIALQLQSYIAWGYPERSDGKFYNACSIVGPSGKYILGYRKINLFGPDFTWASPGDAPPSVVKTDFGRVTPIICRDIRNKYSDNIPKIASDISMFNKQEIDIVIGMTNWGKGSFIPNAFMDLVADLQCTLIVADRWGKEENIGPHGIFRNDFGQGKSCIITPDWSIHKSGLRFDSDCVVTAVMEDI